MPVVQNFPLAFCHPDTIDSSKDMMGKDNATNTNFSVGSLYLLYRPRLCWSYTDQQTSDEIWMFMTWKGEAYFRKQAALFFSSFLHPLLFRVALMAFPSRLPRSPAILLV